MGTKRKPRHRDYRPPISAEASAVWKRLRELERQGTKRGDEYAMLGKRLCGLVGLSWPDMWWPTDNVASPTPPPRLRDRPSWQRDAYMAAHRARLALEQAEAAAEAATE